MSVDILIEYCRKCKLYGLSPSWDGLKLYNLLSQKTKASR